MIVLVHSESLKIYPTPGVPIPSCPGSARRHRALRPSKTKLHELHRRRALDDGWTEVAVDMGKYDGGYTCTLAAYKYDLD